MDVTRARYMYIILISLVLMLKICTVRASTTLTDCAAILDGPFIEGQDSPSDINLLEGNEISPVEISCQVTCLNHSVPDLHHNPRLSLVVTELGKFRDIQGLQHGYDTEDGLYQNITYTSSNNCEQANNYMMQYTFAIYPTIKMDRTVARCGVSYRHDRPHCWGEPVIFIRYVNIPTTDDPKPTTCIAPTATPTSMIMRSLNVPQIPILNGTGTGGAGLSAGNLVTVFSPLVAILALALVVVITIAIVEGVIIAVGRRPLHRNRNDIGPLHAPEEESTGSVTPPNELRGNGP